MIISTEGDHIKVTASKFPFPTVCADKQSTDWFHAIARTLKWNERERQKSFVVVEEGPARNSKKKQQQPSAPATVPQPGPEEPADESEDIPDEEEEEVDEEDEDDKFDIDDSSAEAQLAKDSASSEPSPGLPAISRKATADDLVSPPASGTGTPDRFKSSKPQPPPLASRHLVSDAAKRLLNDQTTPHLQTHHHLQPLPPVSTSADQRSPQRQREMQVRGEDGERDFIRAPESLMQSNKSKIPKDRDVEAESMRTPRPGAVGPGGSSGSGSRAPRTADPTSSQPQSQPPWVHSQVQPHSPHTHAHRNHRRHGSVDSLPAQRRAFAAWGRDESDSNASDSDA